MVFDGRGVVSAMGRVMYRGYLGYLRGYKPVVGCIAVHWICTVCAGSGYITCEV